MFVPPCDGMFHSGSVEVRRSQKEAGKVERPDLKNDKTRNCKVGRWRGARGGNGEGSLACSLGRREAGGLQLFKLLQGPVQGTPVGLDLQMPFLNGQGSGIPPGCPLPLTFPLGPPSKSHLQDPHLSRSQVFKAICTEL